MKEKTSTIFKFEIVGAIFLHTLCRLNIEISNKNLFFLLSFVSMITICLVFPSAWNDATYLRRFGRREEDHLQFPRYFASPRLPCPRCWWMLRIFPPFLSKPASIHQGPLRIGAVTLQRVRLNSLKLRVSPKHMPIQNYFPSHLHWNRPCWNRPCWVGWDQPCWCGWDRSNIKARLRTIERKKANPDHPGQLLPMRCHIFPAPWACLHQSNILLRLTHWSNHFVQFYRTPDCLPP